MHTIVKKRIIKLYVQLICNDVASILTRKINIINGNQS